MVKGICSNCGRPRKFADRSIVLVTNTDLALLSVARAYRDRADCENVFDEIKNQRGWAGFVTQDLRRCRIMARLIALVYNWRNIFTRLAQPDRHLPRGPCCCTPWTAWSRPPAVRSCG